MATAEDTKSLRGTPEHGKYKASNNAGREGWQNAWASSWYTMVTTMVGFAALYLMVHSFLTKQLDVKGCEMAYMRPMYSKFDSFDTEHTRLASKYSLYLYREWGIDEEFTVKGTPVLFIPGNAGSYKQVRSLASESAYHYVNTVQNEPDAATRKRPLDFFSVDFNEDFTAFHGQTVLDQAEYLNDAITFILSLYHTPGSVQRDSHLPDPTSVIIVGHSMGGVVARTMVTMPNYQANSINTIVTLAAPHARAPVSFDGDIVRTYKGVNEYWKNAYAQERPENNPLWHTTLISIAGGGLDTIVSSDYASTAAIIPETHSFTVFTSTIPNVWTGMDHLAITWCDQLRKSVVRALYDVVNVSAATQTTSRERRMRAFKKWFLSGLEDGMEKSLSSQPDQILLLEDSDIPSLEVQPSALTTTLGSSRRVPGVNILPVPTQEQLPCPTKFSLLTNEKIDGSGNLDVLFCSRDLSNDQHDITTSPESDLSAEEGQKIRLRCKNAGADTIILPESTEQSDLPFRTNQHTFSMLEYPLQDLKDYQYVVLYDRSSSNTGGWVNAQFVCSTRGTLQSKQPLWHLLLMGFSGRRHRRGPTSIKIHIPAFKSSMLAYKLRIDQQGCEDSPNFFTPFARQYTTDVHESKFFVNVKEAEINIHGISPYLPGVLPSHPASSGLSLQIWANPSCSNPIDITLKVDCLGSLGKLWMRYRIVFAAFPLLVVALVLREQFAAYDETSVFMSFASGMNVALRNSIPSSLAALTILSVVLGQSPDHAFKHELLLGNDDPFFWFLVPLFGLMCISICVALNYIVLVLQIIFAFPLSLFKSSTSPSETSGRTPTTFSATSPRRRILTSLILLSLTSTIIPYHFAYVILCIVQLITSARAYNLTRQTPTSTNNNNFHNYTSSLLILMLFILPINIPVLVVWIRNLTVHWLTPFSSHHNILSIMPFVLLVETMSMGKMVPRQEGWRSVGTEMVLFGLASYAAVFGVSYAYVLHQVGNGFAAWVVGMSFLEGRREGAKVAGTGKVEERLDEGVKRDGKGKE